MGFLRPGKYINKRKLNRTKSKSSVENKRPCPSDLEGVSTAKSNPSYANPTDSTPPNIDSADSRPPNIHSTTSIPTPISLSPPARPTLQSLPVEILQTIFIYSGPFNNLPFLNKYFNHLLQFNPHEVTESSRWHNISLALEMIRRWYLVDANSRVDFNLVNRKLKYYRQKVEEILIDWVATGNEGQKLQRDQVFRAVNSSIEALDSTLKELAANDKFFLETIFLNRFITSMVLKTLGDHQILGEEDSYFEVRDRLKFIRLKFKEIFTRLYELVERLNSGEICTATSPRKLEISELESVEEVVNDENEPLPIFNDESVTVTPWMKRRSTRSNNYQYEQHGYTFKIFNYERFRNFPPRFYKGISDQKLLEWIKILHHVHAYNYLNVDLILQNTFETFLLENTGLNSNNTSLKEIIEFVLKSSVEEHLDESTEANNEESHTIPITDNTTIPITNNTEQTDEPPTDTQINPSRHRSFTDRPLVHLLKMYHNFENIDCTKYGRNYNNDTLTEDISKTLIILLSEFYGPLVSGDDTNLWLCVVELKNFNLAQVLMKFNKNPVIEFLHDVT